MNVYEQGYQQTLCTTSPLKDKHDVFWGWCGHDISVICCLASVGVMWLGVLMATRSTCHAKPSTDDFNIFFITSVFQDGKQTLNTLKNL